MNLKSDKRALESQRRELGKSDDDARSFNKELNALSSAIYEDMNCSWTAEIASAADGLRDMAVQGGSDSCIRGADDMIIREIKTIEAAIEAQKRAAEALKKAAGK